MNTKKIDIALETTKSSDTKELLEFLINQPFLSLAILQDNVFKKVNNKFLEVTGYTREEVRSWGPGEFLRVIHPDYRELVKTQAIKKQKGEKDYIANYTFRGLKKDGTSYWAEVHSKSTIYKGKKADLIVTNEITDKVYIEGELKRSEQKYRELFENSPNYILIINENWVVFDSNKTSTEVLGFTKSEIVNKTLVELGLIDESLIPHLKKRTKQLYAGEKLPFIQMQIKRKDGTPIWINSQPSLVKIGGKNFIQLIGNDITKNKEAEHALKKSEKRFRVLAENAPIGIFETDKNGDCIYVNKNWLEIAGISKEEAYDEGWAKAIHPEDRERIQEKWYEAVENEASFEDIYRFLDPMGKITHVHGRGVPIFNENSNISGYIGNVIDISEILVVESKIKESERKFRLIISDLDVGYFRIDLEGTILLHNPSFATLLGMKETKNLIGRTILNFWAVPQERANYITQLGNIGYVKNYQIKAKKVNKETIYILVNSHIVNDIYGDPLYIEGTFSDITEKIIMEKTLRDSEERFRLIAEQSIIGLNVLNNSKMFYLNKATADILGYDFSEIRNWKYKNFLEKVHPDDLKKIIKSISNQIKNGNLPIKFSCRIYTKVGKIKWIEVISKLINYRNNRMIFNMMIDITEIKKAQEELIKLNKLKSDILARTSHELKTPLVSIKGFSALLKDLYQDQLKPEMDTIVEEILQGCERLEDLIKDILTTSELQSKQNKVEKQSFDLEKMTEKVLADLGGFIKVRKHNIIIEIDKGLKISYNPKMFEELVGNLVINAIKYTPPGGFIEVAAKPKKENIIFSVKDNGIGMTQEEQKHIFTEFGKVEKYGMGYDIDIEGSGLGLYICKKIVEIHGGEIWMESKGKNRGSTFYFSIIK